MLQRLSLTLAMAIICPNALQAEEEPGFQRAREFWAALARGETARLKDFYAPKVMLKAGSELLKKEWGINAGGDRDKDLEVERDKLLGAYERMIGTFGKKRWAAALANLNEKEQVIVTRAKEDNELFSEPKKGTSS